MTETEDFLAATVPRLAEAETTRQQESSAGEG